MRICSVVDCCPICFAVYHFYIRLNYFIFTVFKVFSVNIIYHIKIVSVNILNFEFVFNYTCIVSLEIRGFVWQRVSFA